MLEKELQDFDERKEQLTMKTIVFLLISAVMVFSVANPENNSKKCDSVRENCQQFTFGLFQRDATNDSIPSEQKTLKVDFDDVENRILFDKMKIKEDGN